MGPEEDDNANDEDENDDSNDMDEDENEVSDEPGIADEPFRDPDWDDPEDDVREPD